MKKILLEIYFFFRDIALFASYSHKVPTSFIWNILPYQNLRVLIDIFLTKKFKKKIIKNKEDNKKSIFIFIKFF